MPRSKWKGPYVDPTLCTPNSRPKKFIEIQTKSRNSEIIPCFVGKKFSVHTGNSYSTINVIKEMVGHKFGEFAFSRKRYSFKKKLNKK